MLSLPAFHRASIGALSSAGSRAPLWLWTAVSWCELGNSSGCIAPRSTTSPPHAFPRTPEVSGGALQLPGACQVADLLIRHEAARVAVGSWWGSWGRVPSARSGADQDIALISVNWRRRGRWARAGVRGGPCIRGRWTPLGSGQPAPRRARPLAHRARRGAVQAAAALARAANGAWHPACRAHAPRRRLAAAPRLNPTHRPCPPVGPATQSHATP